ncbi:hypothetical protein PENSPDRAFT_664616 [Peniophora sp. CONT]|nr:hypothetical protein PENSPDRAFT_664616 [Peniophora sp. CONT]
MPPDGEGVHVIETVDEHRAARGGAGARKISALGGEGDALSSRGAEKIGARDGGAAASGGGALDSGHAGGALRGGKDAGGSACLGEGGSGALFVVGCSGGGTF